MVPRLLQLLLISSAALTAAALSVMTANGEPVTFELDEEVPPGTRIGSLSQRLGSPEGTTFAAPFMSPKLQRLDPASGLITTVGRLDRESLCPGRRDRCELEFLVRASTGVFHRVRLIVRDVNDNRPHFKAPAVFAVNISESAAVGALFSLPLADDLDGVDDHRRTLYDLEPGDAAAASHFRLAAQSAIRQQLTPKLELIKRLDRESRDRYRLRLLASDAEFPDDKHTLIIDVFVQDANDNPPSWPETPATLTIAECDPLHRRLLRLRAVDPDLNERIAYFIASTASKEVATAFYISGDFLKQNRSLDYENQAERALFVPVVAEDSGKLLSETEVQVRLTDCNDNYPTIQLSGIDVGGSSSVNLTENDSTEVTLAQVKASDADAGDNGTVDCVAMPADRFRLVPVTIPATAVGDQTQLTFIYDLRKPAGVSFDREVSQGGQVAVSISCTDRGKPQKVTRRPLTVSIADVNDNPPRLERSFYQFRLRENNPLDAFVGAVSASDPDDASTPLRFDLDAAGRQFFTIRPTSRGRAEIRARVAFDREERSAYKFAVIVSDGDGAKDSLSATASVEVAIDDVDDSPPVFQQPVYHFRVVEDFGANYSRRFIGAVTATDADVGTNAEIRYKVGSRHANDISFYFEGNRLYGRGNFDRERQETLSLEVQAVGADAFASAQVTIALLDVNDNRPTVEGLSRVHNLSSGSPAGTQLLPQARGRDDDAGDNGTIDYFLEEVAELGGSGAAAADAGGPHFSMDRTHGMVTLIRPFNRGVGRRFRLSLLARDRGQPPLESRHVTFVHLVDAAHAARAGAGAGGGGGGGGGGGEGGDVGEGGGSARGRAHRAQADRNLLLLLCLAAVVFVIFVALLAVLLYMHAWGRHETARTAVRTNQGAAWYARANADPQHTADEPSVDMSEAAAGAAASYQFPDILTDGAGVGYRSATLVIDNAGARSPGGGLKHQRKFSSSGYLTAPQRQAQLAAPKSSANSTPQQRSLAQKAFNGYETTIAATSPSGGSAAAAAAAALTMATSDRMSRKYYATISGDAAAVAAAAAAVEENRYASASRAPAIDRQGYAVLASDTALAAAGRDAATAHLGSPVCRTPYATSSFV